MSAARIDTFYRGKIIGHAEAGTPVSTIVTRVRKTDGKKPKVRSVQKTILKAKTHPDWLGENAPGGPGRKATITDAHRRLLVKLVFKERGRAYVTMRYCKQRLPCLRPYSRWVLAYALHGVGFEWLRRRSKKWVRPQFIQPRLQWARWIPLQTMAFLRTFAYVDGTTFYLARGGDEVDDQARKRLGQFMWRMSSSADGLYNDNVSASVYAAHQGRPVKMWGFLANGKLCYHILPSKGAGTTHMNGKVFRHMMNTFAGKWINTCWPHRKPSQVQLVMDYERCLRTVESLECVRSNGLTVLTKHPKSSADLNSIENVWHFLKQRLDATSPDQVESREDFLIRLRAAVQHLNTTKSDVLQALCFDQQKRARLVKLNSGGRIRM